MNTDNTPEPTVQTLLALQTERDAVRLITERLKAKEMGPADHIRTKHEVKAFVDSAGNTAQAVALIERARERRTLQESRSAAMKIDERRGQSITE